MGPLTGQRVAWACPGHPHLAELKEPRTLLRIRPEIFDFEPDLGPKLGQTKPKISSTVPTNRHTTIPNGSRPISACLDDDPSKIAQPSYFGWRADFKPPAEGLYIDKRPEA